MLTQPSDLYIKLAESYNLPVETIRELIVYFWRTGVKRNLEAMVEDEIYINRLGSFKIKDYKLKYAIPESQQYAGEQHRSEIDREYYSKLHTQLVQLSEKIEKRKKEKEEFKRVKEHSKNISESPSDMGRATE